MSAAAIAFAAGTPPAAADQATVEHQIAALQARMAADAGRVHQLTLAYSQAETEAAGLAAQVAADDARVAQAGRQLAGATGVLRQELVLGYVGGIAAPTVASDLTGPSVSDPAVREGYVEVATATLQGALDAYRTNALQLASARRTLVAQQSARAAAVSAAGAARQQALAEAGADQVQLDSLESRLTSLQAAAAAQAAAGRHAVTAGGPLTTGAPAPPGPAAQGGPVDGGLVAVVESVVSAPPAAPAPPTATAPPAPPTATAPPAPPTATAPPAPPTATAPPPAPAASTTTTAPAAAPVPTPGGGSGDGGAGGVWLQLRECESGDDYQADTGNGFYGAYQFSQATWTDLGYPGRPDQEPPGVQDAAAMKLQAESGWGQWPTCAAALGLG